MKIGTSITAIVLLVTLVIVMGPLLMIWALNTLFALGIAYTFWNWLAVVVLTALFTGRHVKVERK